MYLECSVKTKDERINRNTLLHFYVVFFIPFFKMFCLFCVIFNIVEKLKEIKYWMYFRVEKKNIVLLGREEIGQKKKSK